MYFMPFLDFRIVLRFEVDFNRHLAVAHNVRQGPASWNVVSATDHINVGIICYYGHEFPQYQKISNNCSTVRELFPIGRWAISTLVQFGCFSMRQGLDLGVRYSRISFLCLFRTDRPTYIISISKETTVLNKIKLILSKRNSNNDLDLEDHYLNPGIHGPKPVDPGPSGLVLVLRPDQQLQNGPRTGPGQQNVVNLGSSSAPPD